MASRAPGGDPLGLGLLLPPGPIRVLGRPRRRQHRAVELGARGPVEHPQALPVRPAGTRRLGSAHRGSQGRDAGGPGRDPGAAGMGRRDPQGGGGAVRPLRDVRVARPAPKRPGAPRSAAAARRHAGAAVHPVSGHCGRALPGVRGRRVHPRGAQTRRGGRFPGARRLWGDGGAGAPRRGASDGGPRGARRGWRTGALRPGGFGGRPGWPAHDHGVRAGGARVVLSKLAHGGGAIGGEHHAAARRSRLGPHHRIPQHAHSGDLDLHHIAWQERPNPRRRSGEHQVSRLQRHDVRDVGKHHGDAEGHVRGLAMLSELTVHAAANLQPAQVSQVLDRHDPRANGAEGVEALGPGPLPVRFLEVSGGDVVGAGDAADAAQGRTLAHPVESDADHHRDLAFVLHLVRLRRQHDGLPVPDHRGGRLEKDERLLGHGVAQLLGVLGIVAADADDLGRRDDSGHGLAPGGVRTQANRMSVWIALTLLAGGFVLLALGGEALIRGAVSVARLARLSTAVIGLTIVAMGTSVPELSVSLVAALEGRGDIAMGNVVGSNIFNVAAIVGVTALVLPIRVHLTAVKLEWPFMFTALLACLLLARDGLIDRLEAGFFLLALVLFTVYAIRVARTGLTASDQAELAQEVERMTLARRLTVDVGLIGLGLALLAAGARVLVSGAVALAQLAGLSERVIGLTIVAAGTSLPELATSIVAARRGQPDIALANVIGSNVFNVLGILGVVALIRPQTVNPQIVSSDNWWMVGTAFVLFPLMVTGMRVSRLEGFALLAAYVTYVALLL